MKFTERPFCVFVSISLNINACLNLCCCREAEMMLIIIKSTILQQRPYDYPTIFSAIPHVQLFPFENQLKTVGKGKSIQVHIKMAPHPLDSNKTRSRLSDPISQSPKPVNASVGTYITSGCITKKWVEIIHVKSCVISTLRSF